MTRHAEGPWWWALGVLLAWQVTALAQAAPESRDEGELDAEAHAEGDAAAPLPGRARPLVREAPTPAREKARWIPRVLLFYPRMVFEAATAPLVKLAEVEDRYQVSEHVLDFLFNEDRTFGVYPTFFTETGGQANVGVRLVHLDLWGDGGSLRTRAGFGGVDQQAYEVELGSGRVRGLPLQFFASGLYRLDDRRRWFGLGNARMQEYDLDDPELPMGVDPRARDTAIETEYVRENVTGRMWADYAFADGGLLRFTQWVRRRRFRGRRRQSDDPVPIDVYDPRYVVGYQETLVDSYTELLAAFDSRAFTTQWRPFQIKVVGWGGVQATPRLGGAFGRVGVDVQPFVWVYRQDRVLKARLRVASVIGPYEVVPFEDLSQLGGNVLLRGYGGNRFTDRASVLTGLEYQYPIALSFGGYVFADAGRVLPGLSDFTFRDFRFGFGGGFRLLAGETLIARLELASSVDGGFRFNFVFGATDVPGNHY